MEAQKIIIYHKLLTVSLFVFLAVGSCLYSEHYVFAQTDQTASKLQAANTSVEQAFTSVLDAEKAGAYVTGLLAQLNTAEDILAQAENYYRTGNSNAAAAQADTVLLITQQVTTAAQNLKQATIITAQNTFWSVTVLTAINIFFFVFDLYLFWIFFKRRYINSLSKAKPEANS